MTRNLCCLLALALVLIGCASASADPQAPRRDPYRITAEEIRQMHFNEVYEVIHTLRPTWLRTRGRQSITDPEAGRVLVYVDGVRAGGAQFLRQITPDQVELLEFLPPAAAASRYGTDHDGGVILVYWRRQ